MRLLALAAVLSSVLANAFAASVKPEQHPIPSLVQKDGRFALMVDGAPFLILGAQANNSSAWPATLPKVWRAIEELHANTLEIPIYWEQFEPEPGRFNYTVLDTILSQARQHHVRLILLWFGTWKNGSQHYMPVWMKAAPERYFHVVDAKGHSVDSPSPFCQASLDADMRAFTGFMRHLKTADPERTVIMVQVENETGTWGPALRDHSPAAEKLFESSVPPEILKAMGKTGIASSATWPEAFGSLADVYFHAWSIAHYVQQVAAAGKAVYPLPLYVNAALRDPLKPDTPGTYESGGPTDTVIPIWKVAAPALDLLAPDIYLRESEAYLKILDLYHRPDNALFIPETTGSAAVARFLFSALDRNAIGFAPFGLDYTRTESEAPEAAPGSVQEFLLPTAQNYRLLGGMMREIARLNFEGKLQAVAEEKGKPTDELLFSSWRAIVSYGAARNKSAAGNPEPTGRALVAQLKDNEFLVTGISSRVDFAPVHRDKSRQYLQVEEGTYDNGTFHVSRILNGDQTDWGLNFGTSPEILRVSVATY